MKKTQTQKQANTAAVAANPTKNEWNIEEETSKQQKKPKEDLNSIFIHKPVTFWGRLYSMYLLFVGGPSLIDRKQQILFRLKIFSFFLIF